MRDWRSFSVPRKPIRVSRSSECSAYPRLRRSNTGSTIRIEIRLGRTIDNANDRKETGCRRTSVAGSGRRRQRQEPHELELKMKNAFCLLLLLASPAYCAEPWKLVWSDEFNTNGPPDPANWNYERGFVRNEERQWYQPENAVCTNGLLVIE